MKIKKLKLELDNKEDITEVAVILDSFTLEDIETLKSLVGKNFRIISTK